MGLFDKIKNIFFNKNIEQKNKDVKTDEIKEKQKENSKTLENLVKPVKNIEIEGYPLTSDDNIEGLYIEDLWNYIDPAKNTQAHHALSVIGFDEWVDMEEIRNRIKSMFFIEYKNEKSLYPYIKTLTDIGLLESTSVGGKRKWKKKEIVIKLKANQTQTIRIQNKIRN